MQHRQHIAEALAAIDRNRRESRDLERAEAARLFLARGFALVWRPGLAAPATVASLAEYDAVMR
jgi:hypothetical protein